MAWHRMLRIPLAGGESSKQDSFLSYHLTKSDEKSKERKEKRQKGLGKKKILRQKVKNEKKKTGREENREKYGRKTHFYMKKREKS